MTLNTLKQALKLDCKFKVSVLIVGIFVLLNSVTVLAKGPANSHTPHSQQSSERNKNDLLSSEDAAQIAQQGRDTQVLKVQKKGAIYRVKLLTKNGRVKYVNVDAFTGNIMRKPR